MLGIYASVREAVASGEYAPKREDLEALIDAEGDEDEKYAAAMSHCSHVYLIVVDPQYYCD